MLLCVFAIGELLLTLQIYLSVSEEGFFPTAPHLLLGS